MIKFVLVHGISSKLYRLTFLHVREAYKNFILERGGGGKVHGLFGQQEMFIEKITEMRRRFANFFTFFPMKARTNLPVYLDKEKFEVRPGDL